MFNTEMYYLGKLCPYDHEHEDTGKSLRYKNQWKCVECMRQHVSNWCKESPDKKRLMDQKYSKTETGKQTRIKARNKYDNSEHGRKVRREVVKRYQHNRRAAGKMPPLSWFEMLYKFMNGLCAYCGRKMHNNYQIDHIVPVSKGGTNDINNLTICCGSCNASKRDRDLHTWEVAHFSM